MRIRLLLFLAAVLLLSQASPLPRISSETAFAGQNADVCSIPVLRVVDGDTIVVRFNGRKEKIRLLNVDTPESVHPDRRRNTALGKAASDYTRALLSGETICLEFEGKQRGNYGRLLAYVIRDGQNFNIELVRQGWSPYYTKYGPSPRYHHRFLDAQTEARSAGRRIWAEDTNAISGADHRPHLAAAAETAAAGPFRGNTGSRIFHGPACRWYGCKHCTRIFSTWDEAIAAGFRPCGQCRP